MSEISKVYFDISLGVQSIFAVYRKYAKYSNKKCVFADFMGFFAKMQPSVCPPNKRLSSKKVWVTKYLRL